MWQNECIISYILHMTGLYILGPRAMIIVYDLISTSFTPIVILTLWSYSSCWTMQHTWHIMSGYLQCNLWLKLNIFLLSSFKFKMRSITTFSRRYMSAMHLSFLPEKIHYRQITGQYIALSSDLFKYIKTLCYCGCKCHRVPSPYSHPTISDISVCTNQVHKFQRLLY